jgi:hypothetical protein
MSILLLLLLTYTWRCENITASPCGFSGLFDDFAFFSVLAVDIAALLKGFRRPVYTDLIILIEIKKSKYNFKK